MKIYNFVMNGDKEIKFLNSDAVVDAVDIVFIFATRDFIKEDDLYQILRGKFNNANIVGCSSSGNILGTEISKYPLVGSAVKFEKSRAEAFSIDFQKDDSISEVSSRLIEKLKKEDLKHIFILSDGLKINGSELVRGINTSIEGITVTGGMAGDGDRFEETFVMCNNNAKDGSIAIVGFYGSNLSISSGCFGGWSEFGAQRVITKSSANVLYEIDGEAALDFYKRYLGDYASALPNSGLRFPLSIKKDSNDEVIRTLLSIDEEAKSITFAGDVPQGYYARLMKPNIDALIDGAGVAAGEIEIANDKSALGLVVSCVGRKIVLGELIDEELEEVSKKLGNNMNLVGFYSYGEIAPFLNDKFQCELHNQTMTLTAIYEN